MPEKYPSPTGRELEILKVLWDQGEATVRQVYEVMRQHAPIVQNTVQAFLRTMEEKGLVEHRLAGRTFVYRPASPPQQTRRQLTRKLLERVYDGAMDQLVDNLLSLRRPSEEELARLEELIQQARRGKSRPRGSRRKERP